MSGDYVIHVMCLFCVIYFTKSFILFIKACGLLLQRNCSQSVSMVCDA